jgi:RimJ/RimL family protein N-acetyltransferase
MTPTISTERLMLRPLTKPTSRQLAWLRDPAVVQYSQQRHRTHTLSTQLHYVNSFVGRSHLWAIHHVGSGEHIGNLSAMNDEPNNVSDVGIMIGESKYWNHGYGREAWRRACEWLLDPQCGGVRKLQAGCARTNTAMLKIIRDSGFKQEGELLNQFMLDGGVVSALLFGRMK